MLARELGTRAPRARPGRAVGPVQRRRPRRRGGRRAGRGRTCGSPASRSASRASTRCSSPSPATRPRPTPPTTPRRRSAHEHRDPGRQRSARRSPRRPRPPRASAVSAALTFGWRGMLKVKHVPEQLLDVTITPVMFVLMFTYLFGGAIAGSTGEYLDYILPGILVMSVLFTTVYSGVALNTDLTKGVVDRFRSLPIWRPAPLRRRAAGRQRPLPRGGHGDHRARPDPRLPTRRRRAAAWSPRWRWRRVLVRPVVGVHDARPAAAVAERGDERGLHGHLPAHVPEQRVRRPRDAAGRARVVRRTSTRSRSWRPPRAG